MRHILRITAVGALALLGTSCFEPPVSESLLLEFLPEVRETAEPGRAVPKYVLEDGLVLMPA